MATFNTPNVGSKIFLNKLSQVQRAKTDNPTKVLGVVDFDSGVVTVPSTAAQAADVVFVGTFPDNCRLLDLVYISSDRDTGSVAIVEDVVARNSADVDTILINDTVAAQAGTAARLDTAMIGVDVSNMRLGLVVGVSAATPAAGTIRFKGLVSVGKSGYGFISFPASTAS